MTKRNSFSNENPLLSAFWIPLFLLPIISLNNNQIKIESTVIPQTFYQHQINYFDHRNAVITFWDTVVSQTGNNNQRLRYSSDHKSNRYIKINTIKNNRDSNDNDFVFNLRLGKTKSHWNLSTSPKGIQLPRVHKLGIQNSQAELMALQFQLGWYKKLNWADIGSKYLPTVNKLILEIDKLQNDKNLPKIENWIKLQIDLHRLLTKFHKNQLFEALAGYLNYQKALSLLELAFYIRKNNLVDIIELIIKFELLDSLIIDENDLLSLPKTTLRVELGVLIDPDKLDQYRYHVISKLSEKARSIIKLNDLKTSPWQCILALARSYQLDTLNPNISATQKASIESKIAKLISPNSENSIAANRALIHPNGADYRIKDTHYKDKFSKFSEHNRISLKPLIIDSKNSFSDSIQTLKLNDSHYVVDTYNKDVFKLNNQKFTKISRLPHDVSPLAQITIQPDPLLGQPRAFIFGGFPESNIAYTSNNLVQFSRIETQIPIEGRFHFGMSQFISSVSGLEKTLIMGGTKGYTDDLARFQDIYSSIDGINWTALSPIGWISRHSFGLAQLQDSLIAFGGCRSFHKAKCFREVWSSTDGANFSELMKAPWTARGGMAYAVTRNELLMFGGANQSEVFSDLWVTSNGIEWKQIPISTIGSVNSQLIVNKEHLWILGGKTKSGRYAPTRSYRISRKALQFL